MTKKRFLQSRHWCIDRVQKRETEYWDTAIDWLNELNEECERLNMILNTKDKTIQNLIELLNFINKTILSSYDILTKCDMRFNEKNNTYEYYIYYDVDLTFHLRNQLNYEILEKIYKYCEKTNCTDFFNNISVFLVIET